MSKTTFPSLLVLLLVSALVAGGFLWYANYFDTDIDQLVEIMEVSAPPPDPETVMDHEVQLSGTNYEEIVGADGEVRGSFASTYVRYRGPDGTYQPIDTAIIESPTEEFDYQNTTNVFHSYFSADTAKEEMAVFSVAGKRSVTFSFVEAQDSEGKTSDNTITYSEVYPSIDAQYTVTNDKLVEELIVKKKITLEKISQRLKLGNVYYKEQSDGSVTFHDLDTKNKVFTMAKPVMYEKNNPTKTSHSLHYEIFKENDYYILNKVIDQAGQDWLNSAQYPVVIDPSYGIEPPTDVVIEEPTQQLQLEVTFKDASTIEDGWIMQMKLNVGGFFDICTIPTGDSNGEQVCSGTGFYTCDTTQGGTHPSVLPGPESGESGTCEYRIYDFAVAFPPHYFRVAAYGQSEFGSSGVVVDANGYRAEDTASDGDYLYTVGHTATADDWRIEKRRLADGALCDGAELCDGVAFDTDGYIEVSADNAHQALAIAIDSEYMYVAGNTYNGSNYAWRIEKRRLDDGRLCTGGACPAGNFGDLGSGRVIAGSFVDGIFILDPMAVMSMAIDSNYMYIVGGDRSGFGWIGWLIQKYTLDTGVLDVGFDADGRIHRTYDGSPAYDIVLDSTHMYVTGDGDPVGPGPEPLVKKFDLADGSEDGSIDDDLITEGRAIDLDSTYLYVTGQTSTPAKYRVEKYRLSDFVLVAGKTSTSIGGPTDIVVDSTYAYSTGWVSGDWVTEKRRLSDLELCTAVNCGGIEFGTSGILTSPAESVSARTLSLNDPYLFIVGEGPSSDWRIEKHKVGDGSIDNAYCGSSTCLDDGDFTASSPAYRYYLAQPLDEIPFIDSIKYIEFRLTGLEALTPPGKTICIKGKIAPDPLQGLTEIGELFGYYNVGRLSPNKGDFTCLTKAQWETAIGESKITILSKDHPGATKFSPDTTYEFGLYVQNLDGAITPPNNTVFHTVRARNPSKPITSNETPTSIDIQLNVNPDGDTAYLNPDSTDYALYEETGVQYVQEDGSFISASDPAVIAENGYWCNFDGIADPPGCEWGASGATRISQEITVAGLGVNECYNFKAKSRNRDGIEGEQTGECTGRPKVCIDDTDCRNDERPCNTASFNEWSATESVCTEANVPDITDVACGYDSADGYYCDVTIDNNLNPQNTEYYIEFQTDNIFDNWSGVDSWYTPPVAGSFVYRHKSLDCDMFFTFEYRVKARNLDLVETDYSSAPYPSDTLPPCQPRTMTHIDNPLVEPPLEINWQWQRPAGGSAVDRYEIWDDQDKITDLTDAGAIIQYIQSQTSRGTPFGYNEDHVAYVIAVDTRGRDSQPTPTVNAYTSIEEVNNIEFTDVIKNRITVKANSSSNGFSNDSQPDTGIQFDETTLSTGGGGEVGFVDINSWKASASDSDREVADNLLEYNHQYCYKAHSRNADGLPLAPGDETGWKPNTDACIYTHANEPDAPRIIRHELDTEVTAIVRTTDENPHGNDEYTDPNTQYAMCVTSYDADDQEIYSKYVKTDGTINIDYCSDDTCDNQTDCQNVCISAWNVTPDCKSPDGICSDTQYEDKATCEFNLETWTISHTDAIWDERGSGTGDGWGGDDGLVIDLGTAGKYDFMLKARNGHDLDIDTNDCDLDPNFNCVETVFGRQATLFLVKNNVVGWAWSANAGWISLNCLNFYNLSGYGYTCNSADDWGLNTNFEKSRDINPLQGYAWSSSGQARSPVWNVGTFKDGVEPKGTVGLAYDDYTSGGPYIWVVYTNMIDQGILEQFEVSDLSRVASFGFSSDLRDVVFDGRYLWVSSFNEDIIYKVDPVDGSVFSVGLGGSVQLDAGSQPVGLIFDGTDLWVASQSRGSLFRIRTSDSSVVNEYAVGGVGTDPQWPMYDGKNVWVANNMDLVYKVDIATESISSFGPLTNGQPYAMAFDGQYIWITHNGSGSLTVLDVAGSVIDTLVTGGSDGQGIAYGDGYVWVADSGNDLIYQIDIVSRDVIDSYNPGVGNSPQQVIINGEKVFISHYETGVSIENKVSKISPGLETVKVGQGWLSFNRGMCAEDSQKACYDGADCTGGGSWVNTGNLAGATKVMALMQDSNGDIYAGTSPNGDVFKYDSVLDQWTATGDLSGATTVYALAEDSGGDLYAGTSPNGDVFKYDSGLDQWNVTGSGGGFPAGVAVIYSLLGKSDGSLWAGTDNSVSGKAEVYIYNKGADTWTKTVGNLPGGAWMAEVYSFLEASDGTIYAGTGWDGYVYKTSDGGVNWTQTNELINANQTWMVWGLTEDSDGAIWAATGPDGYVYKSDDGQAWSTITTPLYLGAQLDHINSIIEASDGDIYIAGGRDPLAPALDTALVMRYDAAGDTWEEIGDLSSTSDTMGNDLIETSQENFFVGTELLGDVYRLTGSCIESAGIPPDDITYGYCHDNLGDKHGLCAEGASPPCTEPMESTDCVASESDYCIFKACQVEQGGDQQGTCITGGDVCRGIATANFAGVTREVEGWARILNRKKQGENLGFNDWGWIKLRGEYGEDDSAGPYGLTGTEVDSQLFLGDPDVNPNELALYSLFGWAWQAETSDFSSINSAWLPATDVTQTKQAIAHPLTLDSAGQPHLAWVDIEGYYCDHDKTMACITDNECDVLVPGSFCQANQEIYYIKWDQTAGQWVDIDYEFDGVPRDDLKVPNQRLVTGGVNCLEASEVSLALDLNDYPHLAWQEHNCSDANYDGFYYRYWDGDSWEEYANSIACGFNSPVCEDGNNLKMVLDQNDAPHLVWEDLAGSVIRYRYWDGSGNWVTASGDPGNNDREVDNTGTPSNRPFLAVSSDVPPVPHIVWHDDDVDLGNVYYRYWDGVNWVTAAGIPVDPSLNISQILGANNGALNPVLALDSSNIPQVAYPATDGANYYVYFRKWDGADWVTVSGDNLTGHNGADLKVDTVSQPYIDDIPGLAIDNNDNPHIVWGDQTAKEIFYRYWDDTDAAWETASGKADPLTEYRNVSNSASSDSALPWLVLDSKDNPHLAWQERQLDTSNSCGPAGQFDHDGTCISTDYPFCQDDSNNPQYCSQGDINYTRWIPGKVQTGLGWLEFMPAGALIGVPWVETMFSDIYAEEGIQLAPPPRGSGYYTSTYLILADGSIRGIPGLYSETQTGLPTSAYYTEGFDPIIGGSCSILGIYSQAECATAGGEWTTGAGYPMGQDALSKIDLEALYTTVDSGTKNRYGHEVVEDSAAYDISTSLIAFPDGPEDILLDGKVYYFSGADQYELNSEMTFLVGDSIIDETTGNGLIIIDGDLEINADVYYEKKCETGGTVCQTDNECIDDDECVFVTLADVNEMPSVAFIVTGNIYVNSLVKDLAGVWVAIDPDITDSISEGTINTSRRAPVSASISKSVFEDDDAYVSYDSGAGSYTNNYDTLAVQFGRPIVNITNRAYLRWAFDPNAGDLNVPPGSEVRSAHIKLQGDGGDAIGDFTGRIYLIDYTDVFAFDSFVPPPVQAPASLYNINTSNSLSYGLVAEDWDDTGENITPDIKNLIQKYINSDEYATNYHKGVSSHLGLVIKEGNAEVGEVRSFESMNGSGTPAELVIEYSPHRSVYTVADENDDVQAWGDTAGDCVTTGDCDFDPACMSFGWNDLAAPPRPERIFYRFTPPVSTHQNKPIPEQAEIIESYVNITSDVCGGDEDFQARWGLLGKVDMPAFDDPIYNPDYNPENNFNLSQEVSEVAEEIAGVAWGANEYDFIDIQSLIQAWIDHDDYQVDNNVGFRLRRGRNETIAGDAGEFRGIQATSATLRVDYRLPLRVSGLFIARDYNFDRKYTKDLAASEQIIYDGRVVANTPPGLSDFTKALPVYQRVTP